MRSADASEDAARPSTSRVRRYRERRREGVCCLTVEMYEADIREATARGLLKSDGDAWNVLDAWYGCHLIGSGIALARRQQSNQTKLEIGRWTPLR